MGSVADSISDHPIDVILSPRQYATLDAAARRIVPVAYTADGGEIDVAAHVGARLERAPARWRTEFLRALTVFDSRLAALLIAGSITRFTQLDPVDQERRLIAWAHARVGLARTVYQAIRRLVLHTYYAQSAAHQSIGYLGPLHERAPAYEWERPLPARASNAPTPAALPRPTAAADDARLSADAIVIGSGPGGAVAAARLAEAGMRVLILEEGPHLAADEYTEREGEMTERLYADGALRATDDLAVQLLQGACAGGGSTINWMLMLRTPDYVLDEWRTYSGVQWASAAALVPRFEQVERDVHARMVGPAPDAHSPSNQLLLDGASALGWRARAGAFNASDACVRAGSCGLGCRWRAKQDMLETYLPRAIAAGAGLIADARVERIEVIERAGGGTGAPPRKRVVVTRLDRTTRRPAGEMVVEAPIVVLAAGAVGTPALLIRSGLGGGGVGQWLRLHPTTAVVGVFAHPMYAAAGIPQSALCDEFVRRDPNGYGFWLESAPAHPGVAALAVNGFGAPHREVMRRFPYLAPTIALVRDGADRRRSNGSVSVDAHGTAHVRYRLGPRETEHIIAAIDAAVRLQLAAGATEVRTGHTRPLLVRDARDLAALRSRRHGPNDLLLFSAHVNGTCRMGTDPRTSGATPSGERHGVRGLYIADGSLLPTAPGVNPQETIMMVAGVVAEGILGE